MIFCRGEIFLIYFSYLTPLHCNQHLGLSKVKKCTEQNHRESTKRLCRAKSGRMCSKLWRSKQHGGSHTLTFNYRHKNTGNVLGQLDGQLSNVRKLQFCKGDVLPHDFKALKLSSKRQLAALSANLKVAFFQLIFTTFF